MAAFARLLNDFESEIIAQEKRGNGISEKREAKFFAGQHFADG